MLNPETLKTAVADAAEIAPPERVVPVSVVMIVKDCANSLEKCLTSLRKNFLRLDDELVILDTGSQDDTVKVAKEFKARVIERPDLAKDVRSLVADWAPEMLEKWDAEAQFKGGHIMDFAAARQIVTDAAANDCVFWIDSDDVLEEERPGLFRAVINQQFGINCDSIFLNYLYAFDPEDGKCVTVLKRERILDRRLHTWKGRCHETMIPNPGMTPRPGFFADLNAAIVHQGARHDGSLSDIRNYCIIRTEVEEALAAGQEPDTRSIFYLGNAARGLRKFPEAIEMYRKTMALSGSREDRYAAAYFSGITYLSPHVRRPLDALDYAFACIRIKPEDPRGYFLISRCYGIMGHHNEALHWFRCGRPLPEPVESFHSYDPTHITSLPFTVAIKAAQELGAEDEVIRLFEELKQARPDHPGLAPAQEDICNWLAGRKLTDAVRTLLINTAPVTQKDALQKARRLLQDVKNIPPELEKSGLGKCEPVVDSDRPGVTIFCGHTAEPWGPKNAETGIGGSEKMVLLMAKRLVARGFNVDVYANVPPDQRGIEASTGVNWRHAAEFDYDRPRDTVIFWRSPEAVLMPIPTKKRIVWCHDVQDPARWTDEVIATVDQVWVLSEFHATTLGPARAKLGDKLVITRNAIEPEVFAKYDGIERNPKSVVYCSSPDRGVLTAIKLFQEAFKGDLDARLHICYGFTKAYTDRAKQYEYGHVPDVNRDVNLYSYMQDVYKCVDKDPRIFYHGRLNWDQLAKLMSESGVWLYPTRFPEISCMAAMEAQAAGCIPVATKCAALEETLDWNYAVQIQLDRLEQATMSLKAVTSGSPRLVLGRVFRERFDADALADEWAKLIIPNPG